MTQETTNPLDV